MKQALCSDCKGRKGEHELHIWFKPTKNFWGTNVWMMRCGKKRPQNNIGRFSSHHKTFTDKLDIIGSYPPIILESNVRDIWSLLSACSVYTTAVKKSIESCLLLVSSGSYGQHRIRRAKLYVTATMGWTPHIALQCFFLVYHHPFASFDNSERQGRRSGIARDSRLQRFSSSAVFFIILQCHSYRGVARTQMAN